MERTAQLDKAIDYARKIGAEHGRNAAAWYAQDAFGGRVTRGADENASRIIGGMEDGDPEVYDSLPQPDLSGQWADSLTGPELVNDALVATDEWDVDTAEYVERAQDWFSDICDAYEDAFREACEDEIERAARLALS